MTRLAAGLTLCLWTTVLPAQRAPTMREWMSLAAVDAPAIAPDGRTVAYQVVTPDWSQDGFTVQLWVVAADGSGRRQVTNGAASSRSARWSPDGQRLAFLSSRGSGTQVYLMRMPDGPPVQLTRADNGVDDFRWSPDGRQIAFLSGTRVAQADSEPKEFHVVGNDETWSAALWTVPVPTELSGPQDGTRLTDPTSIVADDIVWSPDSKRIAFNASPVGVEFAFNENDIYIVDVGSKSVRRIVETPGRPEFWPIWSPDGRQVAYRTYVTEPGQEYGPHSMGSVAVVSADGGSSRVLTEGFDEQATAVAWTTDGIWFTGRIRTFQHLFLLDPATREFRRVTGPLESNSYAFSFTSDGRNVAFVGSDAAHYQEVFVSPVTPTLTPRRLTRMGDQLAAWTVATRELVSWTSKDGTPIEGVLIKPPRFDASRQYPLVVIVHGGPQDQDQATITRDYPYMAELYAQQGFLVLRPNYRGSIGYGKKFREALSGHLGEPEYQDIVTGVDYLVRQGWADSSRVGIMGWSHGGYLAAFSALYGHRFTAASVGAGVSDLRIFYTLGAGSSVKPTSATPAPWDEVEYYHKASPLTYVKGAQTPTLIQHGERDNTAPIAGAQELYRALKDQGVTTRMIVYRGAGHLPNGLKQFEDVSTHNLEWFVKYLRHLNP